MFEWVMFESFTYRKIEGPKVRRSLGIGTSARNALARNDQGIGNGCLGALQSLLGYPLGDNPIRHYRTQHKKQMNTELKNQIKANYERVSGSVKENAPKVVQEAKEASKKMDDYLSTPEKLGPLILEQVILVFVGILSAAVVAILGHVGLVMAFVLIVFSITRFINIGKQREQRLINKTVVESSVKNAVEVAYASAAKKFGTDTLIVVPPTAVTTEEPVPEVPHVAMEALIKQEPEEHRFPGAFSSL